MKRIYPVVFVVLAGLVSAALPISASAHRGSAGREARAVSREVIAERLRELSPAARDAIALERFYRKQGKSEQAAAMYQDLLKRSDDPSVRQLAHRRLARWSYRQGNVEAAEQHLRDSLEEQLRRSPAPVR